MMKFQVFSTYAKKTSAWFAAISLLFLYESPSIQAQYGYGGNQYGGYNQYGGNQYGGNQYGGGYGGSSFGGGGFGGSRLGGGSFGGGGMGGSRFGGRMSSRGGGGYGGSSYGGGYGGSSYGGMGMGGGMSSGRSGRGRSGRSGGGYSSGYNSYGGGYGNQQGYNQGYSSSGRGSRRSGGYNQQGYGGYVPQSGQDPNNPGRTQPSGTSSERRQALGGNASRGAMSSRAGSTGGSDTGISIQGGGNAGGGAQAGQPPRAVRPGGQQGQQQETIKLRSKATLLLTTPSPHTIVGEPFAVDLSLVNPNRLEFDTVSVALKYNPRELKPVLGRDEDGEWIAAGQLATSAAEIDRSIAAKPANAGGKSEPWFMSGNKSVRVLENRIDNESGWIRFEARYEGDPSKDSGIISSMLFVPLVEQYSSEIDFIFSESGTLEENSMEIPLTRLFYNDTDHLGSKFKPDDGAVSLEVQIFGSREKADRGVQIRDAGERDESILRDETLTTHLYLIPRQNIIDVGDIVEVDVYLKNPDLEKIDSLNLFIAFNPQILQVEDGDDLSTGVNLSDRDYKGNFPFDFPVMNTVDNEKGIIDYRVQGMKKAVSGEGEVATIRFRALRPTKKSTLRVLLSETGAAPTTGIFYKSVDVLGDPTVPTDGVTTTALEVQPTMAYLKKIGLSG